MQHVADMPVALVTGASGGIGRAIALRLAEAGFRVFGTSRHPTADGNSAVEMLPLDVRDAASVAACVAAVVEGAGRIDVLVNNAGTSLLGAVEETSTEEAQALFEVNFFGVHRMVRAVLPQMRSQGKGSIVTIGSIAGFLPKPYEAFYSASKHALEGYMESLQHEVSSFGIRAALMEPNYMRTGLGDNMQRARASLPPYASARSRVEKVVLAALVNGGEPRQVAEAVIAAVGGRGSRLRHLVGGSARRLRLLRSLMPAALFAWGLRREFRLDR